MALKPAQLQWTGEAEVSSAEYGDVYFQPEHGLEESTHVFLKGNRLEERFAAADVFRIAELGFGTGLNFLLAARLWRETAPKGARLFYASVEKHPIEKKDLARIYAAWPELREFSDQVLAQYPPLIEGFHPIELPGIQLMLLFGDVAEVLPQLGGRFDAWFLDGFSPAKNPDMWAENLFPLIAARTVDGGTLATFSSAGAVRRGLEKVGFKVDKVEGFGTKREMTVASFPSSPSPPTKWVGEGRGEGGGEAGVKYANAVLASTPPHPNPLPPLGFAERGRGKRGEITILGAGLSGASCARALAEKGYRVTVIDRYPDYRQFPLDPLLGVLYPRLTVDVSPMGLFHQHAFCYARAMMERLKPPSFMPCGVLMMDMDDTAAVRTRSMMEKNGWPSDFTCAVKADEVAGVPAGGRTGLFHPTGGCVQPLEFLWALIDHPNIEMKFGQEVTELPKEGPVVLAFGNGSPVFKETAWLPLRPLRGQTSYVASTPESRSLKTIVCHDGHISPAWMGVHVAGATFQKEPVAMPDLREEDHAENLSKVNKNLPALKLSEVVGGRAGWRATTPDHLPLVGRCPDHAAFLRGEKKYVDNLYIAAGLGSHGLSGGPLAGEIIARLIAGDPAPVPAHVLPYLAPERFILREMKRGRV